MIILVPAIGVVLGAALGIVCGVFRFQVGPVWAAPMTSVLDISRSIPLLVQLLLANAFLGMLRRKDRHRLPAMERLAASHRPPERDAGAPQGPRPLKGRRRGGRRQAADPRGSRRQAQRLSSRLPGGQEQRMAIARSLAMSLDSMLFDEVTSALDPQLAARCSTPCGCSPPRARR